MWWVEWSFKFWILSFPFLFLRVHQENKEAQEHLEIKAPQVLLVLLVLMDLVVILVQM